jgi:hypothetical protein
MVSKVAHVQDIAPIDLEQQQHRTLEGDMHGHILDARSQSTVSGYAYARAMDHSPMWCSVQCGWLTGQ